MFFQILMFLNWGLEQLPYYHNEIKSFLLRTFPAIEKLPLQQKLFPNQFCHLEFQMTNVFGQFKTAHAPCRYEAQPRFFHLHNPWNLFFIPPVNLIKWWDLCALLSDAYSRRLNGKALVQNANILVIDWNFFCVTRFLLRKLSNKQIIFLILSS